MSKKRSDISKWMKGIREMEIHPIERTPALRDEVVWFSELMEETLKKNDYKGGWENCDVEYLLQRLELELDELTIATLNGNNEDVIREATDVANFAMMVADNYRRLSNVD